MMMKHFSNLILFDLRAFHAYKLTLQVGNHNVLFISNINAYLFSNLSFDFISLFSNNVKLHQKRQACCFELFTVLVLLSPPQQDW